MNAVTSSLRFDASYGLNNNLRKFSTNLVAFPRLHFLSIGHGPYFSKIDTKSESSRSQVNKFWLEEVLDSIETERQLLANIEFDDGKFLCSSILYRGKVTQWEINRAYRYAARGHFKKGVFAEWIPNNIKTGIISVEPQYTWMNGTDIGNTTSMKSVFIGISKQFDKLFKRKAFVDRYKAKGMDEHEMMDADKALKDLAIEYQDKQDAVVDEEDEDEDEDDNDDEEEDF